MCASCADFTPPLTAALLAAAATSAAAEPLTVTTTVDDELRSGSLRAVLANAQTGDEVVFDVPRPIILQRRLDIVVDGLTIRGPVTIGYGTGGISVSRSNAVVRGNNVRSPAGRGPRASCIVASAGHPYFSTRSHVIVEDNRVRGGGQGLLVVAEKEHEPTFVIRNNRIRHVRGIGLAIAIPRLGTATVTDNIVRRGRKAPSASQVFLGSSGGEVTFERNQVAASSAPSMEVQLLAGSVLVADCRLARGPTHAIRVLAGEGTFYARTNVIEKHAGDAYHFEPGSRGVVSLLGSRIEKVKGAPLCVAEGADVERVD